MLVWEFIHEGVGERFLFSVSCRCLSARGSQICAICERVGACSTLFTLFFPGIRQLKPVNQCVFVCKDLKKT